jgi:NADP-dependent 3-hydroxy acid dehydrogenase YdfG
VQPFAVSEVAIRVGRTLTTLDEVAADIRARGGTATTARVDAMDKAAVDAHADHVATAAGSIDISFNAVAVDVVQDWLAEGNPCA